MQLAGALVVSGVLGDDPEVGEHLAHARLVIQAPADLEALLEGATRRVVVAAVGIEDPGLVEDEAAALVEPGGGEAGPRALEPVDRLVPEAALAAELTEP